MNIPFLIFNLQGNFQETWKLVFLQTHLQLIWAGMLARKLHATKQNGVFIFILRKTRVTISGQWLTSPLRNTTHTMYNIDKKS